MATLRSRKRVGLIKAGVILLLASLVLAVISMYNYTIIDSMTTELDLRNGTALLAPFINVALGKPGFLRSINITVNNTCDAMIEYSLLQGDGSGYRIVLNNSLEPHQTMTIKDVRAGDILVFKAIGECESILLNYSFTIGIYPYKSLAIPSLVLAITGTALLSHGIVLRLLGVEEV